MSSFCYAALPYSSPDILFDALAHHDWSIWLDSGTTGEHLIAAFPAATLMHWPTHTELEWRSDARPVINLSLDSPMTQLIKSIEDHLYSDITTTTPGSIQSAPGALGILSYGIGEQWMGFTPRSDQVSVPLAALGFYTWLIHIDTQQHTCNLIYHPKYHQAQDIIALLDTHQPELPDFKTLAPFLPNTNFNQYQEQFRQIQEYIHNGTCYQINLSMRLTAPTQGDSWPLYQQLRQAHPNPYNAFARFPFGNLLSFSPEEFITLDSHNRLTTRPIKGTLARIGLQDTPEIQQLLQSDKNRAENLMIVDLLRNDLSQVCTTGSVYTPELFAVHSFPTVHHMISTVTGQLKPDHNAWDALYACSPGGSITGAPKYKAMELIRELEPHARHIFCGSLVYKSALGPLKSNLCIRSLLHQQDQLYAWVGSGLVADSHLEDEYTELQWKISKILRQIEAYPDRL